MAFPAVHAAETSRRSAWYGDGHPFQLGFSFQNACLGVGIQNSAHAASIAWRQAPLFAAIGFKSTGTDAITRWLREHRQGRASFGIERHRQQPLQPRICAVPLCKTVIVLSSAPAPTIHNGLWFGWRELRETELMHQSQEVSFIKLGLNFSRPLDPNSCLSDNSQNQNIIITTNNKNNYEQNREFKFSA